VPIVVNVPKCATTATKPLPVIVFGHGLLFSGWMFDAQVAALVDNALADVCHTFGPRQPVTAEDFRQLFQEALG